jgi:preprotein translocase subunit SecA
MMRQTERIIMLQVIDNQWKDHLLSMDELKQGIGNRAYGQKDPLVEYKKESYELFTAMMDRIEDESVRYLFSLQISSGSGPGSLPEGPYPEDDEGPEDDGNGRPVITGGNGPRQLGQAAEPSHEQKQAAKSTIEDFTRNIQRKKEKELAALQFGGDDSTGPKQAEAGQKVGRNDPCPCGSGKKYKKCHGAA